MQLEQIKNNQKNQEDVKELLQYGRRLCLRIDGDDVLQNVMSLWSDADIDLPSVYRHFKHFIDEDV